MSGTKIVVALLAGLTAGAALAILFVPEAGIDTRDKLSESLTNLGESIKSSASEQIDHLTGVFQDKVVNNVREKLGMGKGGERPEDLGHA